MSWSCPHKTKDEQCKLRKKQCKPGAQGCVLAGKFKFMGDESEKTDGKQRKCE